MVGAHSSVFVRIASIALVLVAGAACSKKPAEPPAGVTAASAPAKAASAPAAIAHGTRKQKNLDIPVFVDGKQIAVLRYGELPATVSPITRAEDETKDARFYRLSDYLTAIGVDVAKVKRLDVAGNRDRISSLEGSELRADKDRFVFDFLQKTTGSTMQRWDTTGLKNTDRNFEINAINVFVKTKPWAIDATLHCYLEEGDCKPVARFTTEDVMKGTRVYSDGKLVGYVKRRLLADGVTTGKKTGDGEAEFSVDKYLTSLGIDTAKIRQIDLLNGDSVVGSATAAAWVADREKLTFALQRHTHGKVVVKIPADLQAEPRAAMDRDVQVTAIEVSTKSEPRAVSLVSIDDIPDFSEITETQQRALASAQGGDHERDHQD